MAGNGVCGNVFWQVGSSATIGTRTAFVGNILARASVGLDPSARVSGRALALDAAVTMSGNNTITRCAPTGGGGDGNGNGNGGKCNDDDNDHDNNKNDNKDHGDNGNDD